MKVNVKKLLETTKALQEESKKNPSSSDISTRLEFYRWITVLMMCIAPTEDENLRTLLDEDVLGKFENTWLANYLSQIRAVTIGDGNRFLPTTRCYFSMGDRIWNVTAAFERLRREMSEVVEGIEFSIEQRDSKLRVRCEFDITKWGGSQDYTDKHSVIRLMFLKQPQRTLKFIDEEPSYSLDSGADILKNPTVNQLLQSACEAGDFSAFNYLIEYIQNKDSTLTVAKIINDTQAMFFAIKGNQVKMARYFAEQGVPLESQYTAPSGVKATCLGMVVHFANQRHQQEAREMMKFFINSGANYNFKALAPRPFNRGHTRVRSFDFDTTGLLSILVNEYRSRQQASQQRQLPHRVPGERENDRQKILRLETELDTVKRDVKTLKREVAQLRDLVSKLMQPEGQRQDKPHSFRAGYFGSRHETSKGTEEPTPTPSFHQ